MRIIGGTLKKKKLGPVPAGGVRPTADRVRESIFNILAPLVRNAVVLDLFAGTGAMGIEALSRGAARAVFVDRHRASQAAIRKNLSACGLEPRSRVFAWDVARGGLERLSSQGDRFTLVFVDPPYGNGMILPALAGLHSAGVLAAGARIVAEHSPQETVDVEAAADGQEPVFVLLDRRRYGKTLVSFFGYMV